MAWSAFYHDFRTEPAGRVVLKICRAESCQAMGALALIDRVCARYNVALGETSRAGLTVEPVYCLGNCALSPAAMVNGRLHGRLDARQAGRHSGGGFGMITLYVPADSAALSVGADETAARPCRWRPRRAGSRCASSATARAACSGSSRWSRP